ncbi:MAG: ribosome assembly RNA-binding protein YhbY [Gammaproteobacteria bacterium]|jgi:RNA-binding protein
MALTNSQKKFLRQSAHHLKPTVWAGKNGITESLIAEIEEVLERHELIKIKCSLGEREERDAGIEEICKKTGADNVQRIGNIVTLYKQNPKNPVIKLPA